MPRALWWPQGGGQVIMGKVPLYISARVSGFGSRVAWSEPPGRAGVVVGDALPPGRLVAPDLGIQRLIHLHHHKHLALYHLGQGGP